MTTAGLLASALTQDIISAALDGDITPESGGLSPFAGVQSGQFLVSGYKALSHDGFSVTSSLAQASGKTSEFDEENYGLTIGTRFDGSQHFGAPAGSVTLGIIANYTHTDIDVGAPSGFPDLSGGTAEVDSWSLGTYGLVTDGQRYGLVTVTGTYGTPETSTTIVAPVSAEFSNFGLATSAMAGVLVPVGASAKLDLRGGLNYVYAESEDFEDSLGTSFTDGRMEEFSGTMSARLFSVLSGADYTIRPFVQGGLTHRLHYENELKIEAETFAFDDADTSVFARAGIDFEVSQSTQAYLAVRGDASEDFEAIAAQVGVTFKLD
jgi:outer membrane autotransporter protein